MPLLFVLLPGRYRLPLSMEKRGKSGRTGSLLITSKDQFSPLTGANGNYVS